MGAAQRFGFVASDIAQALLGLIRLPNVRCEDEPAVILAINALSAGLDFADALHLLASWQADEGFASFDGRFVKRAKKHWPDMVIRTP